ncbi:MAG: hypothetical protein ACRDAU_03870, partial [Clostridium sp.]
MKKLKVSKIVVATTVSASIMMPNIVAVAAPMNVKNKNEIKNNKEDKSNIGVEVGQVQVIKNVSNGTTDNNTYIPENTVPITGNIGTIGTSFQYNVPVEFSSKTGKLYNLENPAISINLNPSGIDGKSLTNVQKLAIKTLENSIDVQVQKYSKEWNTSGSYIFSALIGLNNALNGIQLNPVMNLSYKINGQKKEKDIQLGKILLTKKYSATIKASPTLDKGSLDLNINYYKDQGEIAKYDINNLGYIYGDHNIKKLSFSLSVPKGLKVTPINNSDLKLHNNTYTLTGALLDEALKGKVNLFNIEYGNEAVYSNIGINLIPESNEITFNNGKETEQGTGVNYEGGSVYVQYIPKQTENKSQDKFNLDSVDSGIVLGNGNMTNAIKTKFSAKIDLKSGSGIAYVGSCITNGEGVITQNNKNLASKNMIYVQLPTGVLNEITKGNISEKMNVMEGIINNEYPTYKLGDKLRGDFSPNFVYTTKSIAKGKSEVISGDYIKIPKNYNGWSIYPVSASNTIVGIVYGKGSISNETEFKKSNYDGIEKLKNKDEVLALVSEPDNLIQSTMNSVSPWNYAQSTFYRDGEFSHGVSASSILTWAVSDTRFDKFDEGATSYNERGHGISNQWLNQTKQASWLSQPHTINGVMGINVAADGNSYKKDSYVRVNFGGQAIVTGNIIFNGKEIPSKDIQINNTYVVIKIPAETSINLIKVTVPIQYTNMNLNSITTSMEPCNSMGVQQREVYPITQINGYMSSWGMTGYADNTAFTNTVNFIHNTANVCQQYSDGVSKDNTTTITNVVNNLGNEKTTYIIAGRIPSADNNTLSASVGDLNIGNLDSKLENIDTNGAETWILPSSKVSGIGNKEILDNPYPNTLAGLTENKLKELGWIKYKKGMDLKDIGAYLVKAVVNPGNSYTMHYKIRLTNVNMKKFQATNAEYKYYDNTNNIGSTSPVITLTPNGVKAGTEWMSSVVVQNYEKNSKGKTIIESTSELPENILNETIKNANDTFNNNPQLKDLINNGEDIQNNINAKTPEKLMKLIKFAVNNKEAFEKIGYKLDYISVNGVNIAPGNLGEYSMNEQSLMNWLENTGIANNTTLTKVKFIMSPLKSVPVTISVKVLNSENKVIQSGNTIKEHTVFNGVVGSYLNSSLCKINIPKGYELVEETVNGKKVVPNADGNTTSEILGQSGEEVVYYIRKAPTKIDLKVEYPSGEILNNGEIENSGIPNEETGMKFNGKSINFDGKEINIPNGYEIAETKVIDSDTNKVISITKNKINTISAYRNYNIQVIIRLRKIPQIETNIDTTVETENGTIVVPISKAETIKTGSDLSKVKLPTVPKGYKIVGYKTDGGKMINSVEGTAVVGKEDSVANHIIVVVKQIDSSVTTEVVGPKGEVIIPTSTPVEVPIGSPLNKVAVPKVPVGWKIVKVTTNGKDGSTVTGDAKATPNTIVYHVVKLATGTVTTEVIDSATGKVLVEPTTTNGYEGSKDTSVTPKIPKGYHLVKITEGTLNDNEKVTPKDVTTTGLPNDYNSGHQVVVWQVEKNNTTVNVTIKEGDKVITTTPDKKIKTGSDLSKVKIPEIPAHTHIVSITVNGKIVPENKITGTAEVTPNHIVVNI